jgi:hypothetical protein
MHNATPALLALLRTTTQAMKHQIVPEGIRRDYAALLDALRKEMEK